MQAVIMFLFLGTTLFADNFQKAQEAYRKGSYIKALDLFYALAKKGDKEAQFNVGLIYELGKGIKSDPIEAIRWYEKAANQGSAEAAYNLGNLYVARAKKEKRPYLYKKAKFWLQKGADSGYPDALNNLGVLYCEGLGVKQDLQKAFELFKAAAEKGSVHADYNLANLYAWGDGIERDKMKAYAHFKGALKGGVSKASDALDKLCTQSKWVCEE